MLEFDKWSFPNASAPYACLPEQSRGRVHPEDEAMERSVYQRDFLDVEALGDQYHLELILMEIVKTPLQRAFQFPLIKPKVLHLVVASSTWDYL